MAGTGLDPISAGIGAAGSLTGGILGNKSQDKATAAQAKSNAAALDFQKQQEATRLAQYNKAYDMWNASRAGLMSRYGLDVPGATGTPSAPAATASTHPTGNIAGYLFGGRDRPEAAAMLTAALSGGATPAAAPAGMAQQRAPQVSAYGIPQQQGGGATVADLLGAVQGSQGQQAPDLASVFANRYGLS